MSLGLVAIDLDATLLRNDKSYDIEKFDYIVNKLDQKGIKICIATGNVMPKLYKYIADKTQNIVYLAGDNGNVIAKKDKILEMKTFSVKTLLKIQDLEKYNDKFEFIVSTGLNHYAVKKISEEVKEHVETYYESIHYLDSFGQLPSNEKPVKVGMLSPYDLVENKKFLNDINSQIPRVSGVTSGGSWVDVYPEDGGKGYAVRYLQNKYNISKDKTMAFGDSLNDEPMMEHAKYSIAMENSDNDLKSLCNYEIGNNEDQAVLDVLEKYLQDKSLDFLEK